jgi:SAM-dependent methyltransferase
VEPEIISHLLDLNHRFYQSFALQFSETRQRIQPGVSRVLETMSPGKRLLDLGCGNGEIGKVLTRRDFQGEYVGVDSSAELLLQAKENIPAQLNATLIQADLTAPRWERKIPAGQYDLIFAFAVLHHLPGMTLRLRLVKKIRALIDSEGCFVHSDWQFLNSSRLRERIQDWSKAGLKPDDVDPGDYLLDWRRGGFGLRYVHHFKLEELEHLASESKFTIIKTFYSDGETGDLGLYQIWQPETNFQS